MSSIAFSEVPAHLGLTPKPHEAWQNHLPLWGCGGAFRIHQGAQIEATARAGRAAASRGRRLGLGVPSALETAGVNRKVQKVHWTSRWSEDVGYKKNSFTTSVPPIGGLVMYKSKGFWEIISFPPIGGLVIGEWAAPFTMYNPQTNSIQSTN